MLPVSLPSAVALVTGATSGIGKALATRLASDGATVYVVGRRVEALELAYRDFAHHSNVRPIACDLAVDSDIEQLSRTVRRDSDRLDILAHCAGTIALGALESMPIDQLDFHYRLNTRTPLLLTQQLLSPLRRANGQIVFINSTVGISIKPGVGAYAASKHALRALADTLRAELNPTVRVLTVYPGNTATPMQQRIQEALGKAWRPNDLLQPADVAATIVNALTLPRTAEVTDIHIRPLNKTP
jgi:NAD(P)-dependent dehydrogenase (short-subunit alcohol dehydrogenase family)